MKTKQAVWERQKGVSIFSGCPLSVNECCCHFIPRSKGGLGIEENILGMTYTEHMKFDGNVIGGNKAEMEIMREIALNHLKEHYPNWNENSLIYKK